MLVATLALAAARTGRAEGLLVTNGSVVAFMGDSITADGSKNPCGYVNLVFKGLNANGVKIKMIHAGVGGNKSNDMRMRLDKSVLKQNPTWMTLSCGVNDVWHGDRGIPLDRYQKEITTIVDRAQSNGVQVVILTATLIYEDPNNEFNKKAVPYNDFLRKLAKERKCPLADLNADMRAGLAATSEATRKEGNLYTRDGVHMKPYGDRMMAMGVLRAFGMNDEQMARAEEAWDKLPAELVGSQNIPMREYDRLRALTDKQDVWFGQLMEKAFARAVKSVTGEAEGTAGKK